MQAIGILGCGTMGRAILAGLQAVPEAPDVVVVTARRAKVCAVLAQDFGIRALQDNAAAAAEVDVILLAVKPQVAKTVLSEPGIAEALAGKLLISICAGVNISQLTSWLPHTAIIRAMPNTPCLIREGMTVLSPGPGVSEANLGLASTIFSSVGRCRVLDEKHLDAVTGLSGSGPAFTCVILEALADGGVRMGLPRDVAIELAAQTAQGEARLVLQTGEHPAALKDQVTTPAGCTIAGLMIMEDGRIRSVLARTIEEATRTAGGLGCVD
ncbi:MAG: pyrroline-5-carboxylate reductase [Rhodobacterales bacterium]|nr:pyrroline-5-carboxylate reductase [Rhodobacterales bacterium]